MNAKNKLWSRLLIPFIIGVLIIIGSIVWNLTAHHNDDQYIYSIYLGIFGAMLTAAALIKIAKFNRYIKDNNL